MRAPSLRGHPGNARADFGSSQPKFRTAGLRSSNGPHSCPGCRKFWPINGAGGPKATATIQGQKQTTLSSRSAGVIELKRKRTFG
jgi:hypothetical protein